MIFVNIDRIVVNGVNLRAMPRIHFLDVTNRDGVQTARTGLSKFGKTMVNFYLGRLGVAQSEIGFPFLFHEVPYVRAQVALARAGAFGDLRLSGWCRAVAADVERVRAARPGALQPVDLDVGPDAAGQVPRPARPRRGHPRDGEGGAGGQGRRARRPSGVNAEDGSRTDDGVPHRVRAGRQGGRRRPAALLRHDRRRHAGRGSASGSPSSPAPSACRWRRTATTTSGMAVANSVAGALGDLDAGQDAWINTCVNGIGERSGNADLLSCILALRYGFGVADGRRDRRPARPERGPGGSRSGPRTRSASPCRATRPGVGVNAFAHESGIHADGALKDHRNYELYDEDALGPFPADWHARAGRVVLTGEYGGMAGFRHVMDVARRRGRPTRS